MQVPRIGVNPVPADRTTASATEWWRHLLTSDWSHALCLVLALRAIYSLIALVVAGAFPSTAPCSGTGITVPTLHQTGLDFRSLGVWQRWDTCWYERIAVSGYQPGDPSVAFFPLFPLLVRVGSLLFAGNVTLSGIVIATCAYVAALVGLLRLVRRDVDEPTATRAVLYLSVFPSAFFFFVPYTEALFLALAVWTFVFVRQGDWRAAGITALLAGFTRTQGCVLLLPLAWEVASQWRAGRRWGRWLLVPLLPVLSFLAFLLFSRRVTGWTMFEAQRVRWGFQLHAPWTAITISWRYAIAHTDVVEMVNLICLVLFGGLLLIGLRHLPVSYSLYVAPQLLLIGTREMTVSPLMSTSRLVLVLFPGFVTLAILLRHRLSHYLWLTVSVLLLLVLLTAFAVGRFVA